MFNFQTIDINFYFLNKCRKQYSHIALLDYHEDKVFLPTEETDFSHIVI